MCIRDSAPMDVEAAPGVKAAHVDAFDRTGRGALEACLALDVAQLVVEQLQPAAEPDGHVRRSFGVLDRGLWRKEAAKRQRHSLGDAEAGDEAHRALTRGPARRRSPSRID